MAVRLAAQVLSNSVSSCLCILYGSGLIDQKLYSNIPNTAEYCQFFNDIFDLFNSSSSSSKNPLKQPFKGSETQLDFIRDAKITLDNIKINDLKDGKDLKNSYHFIRGWLQNLSALERLRKNLLKVGVSEFCTRRLCQDELEHFFGSIRRGGGNSPSITPFMFMCQFKKRWG